mmetsp:Transcript_30859/g.66535  ORF Transcript_30859/g.66535 Transcript_30859/m.66535 type:complete len:252 (+) Transcript_30859:2439-3194(+)
MADVHPLRFHVGLRCLQGQLPAGLLLRGRQHHGGGMCRGLLCAHHSAHPGAEVRGANLRIARRITNTYQDCSKRIACSWFSANPVYCLRSQYIYKHSPPCLFCIPGKEHLIEVNEDIGLYFNDCAAKEEDYDAPHVDVDAVKANLKELKGKADEKFEEIKGKASGHLEEWKGKAEELKGKATGHFESLNQQMSGHFEDLQGKMSGHFEDLQGKMSSGMSSWKNPFSSSSPSADTGAAGSGEPTGESSEAKP